MKADKERGLNLRRWTYNGRKIAPAHVIAWKLFWLVPFKVLIALAALVAGIGFGRFAMEDVWNAGR